jgi:hypothetical protein
MAGLTTFRTRCLLLILLSLFVWTCSKSEKPEQAIEQKGEHTEVSAFEYSPTALASLERYTMDCDGAEIDLADPIGEIADAMEDSVFLYNTKSLTDCSGIFHRVLKRMKRRCPEYAYPVVDEYRDSRDIASWYHEQGKLILVKDVFKNTDLIKPGAVLFYGQRDSVYKDFTATDLFERGTGINHVGVVVSVSKDDAGNVTNYELFHGHGRKGKTPASITNYHQREPTRPAYPPYGNGTEQWVAFALLVTPEGRLFTDK